MQKNLFKFIPIFLIALGGWESYNIFNEETDKTAQMESRVPPAEAKNQKLRARIENIKSNESKIAEYETRIAALQKQIDEFKTKMPPTEDKTAVLQELRNSASTINLKEVVFNPGLRKDQGLYFSNGIDMKGRGTFLQFLIFLEQAYSGKRLINVSRFKMTSSAKQSKGRFYFVDVETQVETFEYNPNYVPPAPTPEAPATTAKPKGEV
jgi:Tfp pilus assembly protein PilO